MRRSLIVLLLLAVGSTPAVAGDETNTHTAVSKTAHFDVHVRPGSRAAASAEEWASLAERFFTRIQAQLDFEPPERLRLFLYDSVEELASVTGVQGAGGYSVARTSHLPYDNRQTAYHEMVHLFAEQLPKTGEEKRDFFHVEGLANALLEFVDGVHVHAVARYYRDTQRLPTLAEISTGKGLFGWIATHPKLRAYDIAGSFMRHLLDTYGAKAVKRYYTGTPSVDAFGVDEAALEKGWHQALAAYPLSAEVMTLLRRGDGEDAAFTHYESDPEKRLPREVRGVPGDWTDLTGERMRPADATLWKREDDTVVGTSPAGGKWEACEFGSGTYTDCVAIARLTIPEFCPAVQVRLGSGCQAMFVSNGTFLYRGEEGVAGNTKVGNPGRGQIHLALVRRGHDIRIYVTGAEALHVPNGDATPARVGVGFLHGTIRVHEVKVRKLSR